MDCSVRESSNNYHKSILKTGTLHNSRGQLGKKYKHENKN